MPIVIDYWNILQNFFTYTSGNGWAKDGFVQHGPVALLQCSPINIFMLLYMNKNIGFAIVLDEWNVL